jgi:di/tripeptidase
VTSLYEIIPPTKPKTTYSASVTGGGTSVNSIPGETWMEFDMRSESADELTKLDGQFNQILVSATDGENTARDTRYGKISFDPKVIGFRPAGHTDPKAQVVLLTTAAAKAMGNEPKFDASSTDSNMPMSLGIPAVTIGAGGTGGRAHALDEWIDVEPVESVRGMTVGLAALLSVAGLD